MKIIGLRYLSGSNLFYLISIIKTSMQFVKKTLLLCAFCGTAFAQQKFENYAQAISGSNIKYDMVAIKGGDFMMSSPAKEKDRKEDEGPQHKVKIEPFWMGKYEIPWDFYDLFTTKNGKLSLAHPFGQELPLAFVQQIAPRARAHPGTIAVVETRGEAASACASWGERGRIRAVHEAPDSPDEKPENESGEPPASGGVVVSLDLARVAPPKKAPSPAKKPSKAPRPTIAEQLAAQKRRNEAEAKAARKAAKKARPGKGSSVRDALFAGFAKSLERASRHGEGFAHGEEELPDEKGEGVGDSKPKPKGSCKECDFA